LFFFQLQMSFKKQIKIDFDIYYWSFGL
jgi:hypothetical protein